MLESNISSAESSSIDTINLDKKEFLQVFRITGSIIIVLTAIFSVITLLVAVFADSFHLLFFGFCMVSGVCSLLFPTLVFYLTFRSIWRYGLRVQDADIFPNDFKTLNQERKSPRTKQGKLTKILSRVFIILGAIFFLSEIVFLILALIY